MRLPTLFLPHGGGPCFFLNPDGSCPPMWQSMRDHLAEILPSLPEKPRAILIVSGHWEEAAPTVHTGENPALLFDYYGFPEHTYQLRYAPPGAPNVARRAGELLQAAGFPVGEERARGWDHGVFVPMMIVDGEQTIPVAQVSLIAGLDPEAHLAMGKALAPLRDEGVLIVGSGMSFHNMRAYRTPEAGPRSARFDEVLAAAVTDPDSRARADQLIAWDQLPEGRYSHPREEHLLPLMVAAGAGGDDPAVHLFNDVVLGTTVSAFRFG